MYSPELEAAAAEEAEAILDKIDKKMEERFIAPEMAKLNGEQRASYDRAMQSELPMLGLSDKMVSAIDAKKRMATLRYEWECLVAAQITGKLDGPPIPSFEEFIRPPLDKAVDQTVKRVTDLLAEMITLGMVKQQVSFDPESRTKLDADEVAAKALAAIRLRLGVI